jgi:hypothetical protein
MRYLDNDAKISWLSSLLGLSKPFSFRFRLPIGETYFFSTLGTLSSAGTIIQLIQLKLSGFFNSAGILTKNVKPVLVGNLSFMGKIIIGAILKIFGVLSFLGSEINGIIRGTLTLGQITFSGIILQNVLQLLLATVTAAGTIQFYIYYKLSAILNSVGKVIINKHLKRAYNGFFTFSATMTKQAQKMLLGLIVESSNLVKNIMIRVIGSITKLGQVRFLAVDLSKYVIKRLRGTFRKN